MAVKRARRLASAETAPLGAAAPSTRIGATKLEVKSSYTAGLLRKQEHRVGMKVRVSILFFDAETKVPAAPVTPKVTFTNPAGALISAIAMTEDSTQDGRFTASYIPTLDGEWECEVSFGSPVEIAGKTKFYVS